MKSILCGVETEYGLLVEGRGAEDQVEDSKALVRSYPGECLPVWNYRYESPRADLRGFVLERLAVDPEDMKFESGRSHGPAEDVRSDRILPNGARFYNDHGHPEYSTPECHGLRELALHDAAGELVVQRAAHAYAEESGLQVRIYKNNTDFHGASYGTHENYLVSRELGFEKLFKALLPMLVVRQILTGAGKTGAETGRACTFQISQRADFFVEPANAETLYRRPIFNTRDEPHADSRRFIRLHVISGDANMMPACTARKVGLVQLALQLASIGEAPQWSIPDSVRAFQAISRDETYSFQIPLEGKNWTTAYDVLESYLAAAERTLDLQGEFCALVDECRNLAGLLQTNPDRARPSIDWLAKKGMLEQYMEAEGTDWRDASLRSFDLEYHNVDPAEGLYHALVEMGQVESPPAADELEQKLLGGSAGTRSFARGLALRKFGAYVKTACWRSVTFNVEGQSIEVELDPEREYPPQLADAADVGTFIQMLRGEA